MRRHCGLATEASSSRTASLERCPWRPLMRCLVAHGRLLSALRSSGQWLASTTMMSQARRCSRICCGAWPRSVKKTRERRGENRSFSWPAVKRKPTGSWASCGTAKLSISKSRKRKRAPVSKSCHSGLCAGSSLAWTARAVAGLAKMRSCGNFFSPSMPAAWSPCSWVRKMASIRASDSPTVARSCSSLRAEKPASMRIRAPSVTSRAALPELPLPRMEKRMAMELRFNAARGTTARGFA